MHGKEYTATGEIEIRPGSASSLKSFHSRVGLDSLDEIMETDVAILQSPTLLTDVAKNLNLLDNKDLVSPGPTIAGPNGTKIPLWHGDLNSPWVRNAVADRLRAGLSAARVPRTELISISFRSHSPALSADIVDSVESTFIEENFKSKFNTTQQVSRWLTSQIEDLRGMVQSSQDRMVDLQKKLGIFAFDPQHTLAIGEVASLDKGISDATEARVLAEARYRILSSLPPDQIQDAPIAPGDNSQPLLSGLRTQRATAAASLARLQPVYGPNYPQVKQLNAEIASLDQQISKQEARVVQQAKDAYGVAQSAENQAKSLRGVKEQQFYGQRDDIVHYMLLNEEYESNRQMYESILTRLREAAVDSGLDSADISLVDLASLPISPSSMSPSRLAEVGLLFGLFGGITVALFLEKLDTRLRDAHEIQEMLQLPPLAVIPQGHWKLREADVAAPVGPELLRDPRSAFSESFRALRTSMQLSSTSRQSRLITITSCQPTEGKSTVAVNTAAVLAQGGKRVALVDTDMRRPSVYKRLGIEGGEGLSEVLTGHFTPEQVTHTHSSLDLPPWIRTGASMIFGFRRGRDEQEQAYRGADHRCAEAGRGRAHG